VHDLNKRQLAGQQIGSSFSMGDCTQPTDILARQLGLVCTADRPSGLKSSPVWVRVFASWQLSRI